MDSVNSQNNINTQKEVDSVEEIISSSRPGMKREFKRMVEAHSEMGRLLFGRRSVTRSGNVGSTSKDNVPSEGHSDKKVRRLVSKDKKKDGGKLDSGSSREIEIVAVKRTEVEKVREHGNERASSSSPSKLEMKESKKIELKRIPMKLKDFLGTGLLEGLHICYHRGSKQQELGLHGVIQGTGILCSCHECQGSKIITPHKFEIHAKSKNKRPPEYIYLDNGKSLRDVLNACKGELLDSLLSVIQNAIGRTEYTSTFCLNCKGLISEAGEGRSILLCDSCVLPEEPDACHTQTAHTATSFHPAVLESAETSSRNRCLDKLTRRDLRMHKLVFSENGLPHGATLSCVEGGKIRLQGYKKDEGVFCQCCKEVVSPSVFQRHAGLSGRKNSYMNMYTSEGVSLHGPSLQVSKNRNFSPDESDHYCSICQYGGNMLCCENCPQVFHIECVGLSNTPEGKWYCRYCHNMFEKEKTVECNANAITVGGVPGIDPITEINQRGILTTAAFEADIGECAICRHDDFSTVGFNDRTIMICHQCEKEYHVGCLRAHWIDDLKALPEGKWFCCRHCNDINSSLQKVIGDGEKRLPEPIFNILKTKFEAHGLWKY